MSHKLSAFKKQHLIFLISVGAIIAIVLFLIKGDGFTFAAPKAPPTSSVKISVVSPNGGEIFHQGATNTIKWKGGYGSIAIGLATADADTNHAIALPEGSPAYSGPQANGYTGKVIGFINTRDGGGYYFPNSSTSWNGLKVCNFHLNLDPDRWCVDVNPGKYKIFVWSDGENGQSKCIASGEGPTGKYTSKNNYGCNWDLSDQVFTIAAP